MKRPIIFLALAGLLGASIFYLAKHPLDIDMLRADLARLDQHRMAQPVLVAVVFFCAYVAATALSLPLATWLTLAAGALFGFGWGLLIVSFASTIGATCAFLAARFFLRDWVQEKLGTRLSAINDGIATDGGFYLFTLRLIPAVPFFAVNLLMGLTPIKTWVFYGVSQLGMLAGTAVYVNAGTQLAQLESPSGILSLPLILSFALLGIFPWFAKLGIRALERRRVYAPWVKPKKFDRNLIVIGAGAAGLVSSYIAAAVKAKVTLIETHKMGGDCLNYGCVPSKALIASAKLAHKMRHADHYGLSVATPDFSFKAIFQRIHAVIAEIEPHDSAERYESLGVEVLHGYARLVDPWTVEIAAETGAVTRLTTRAIVIATGAEPFVPPLVGMAESGYVTSDTLWDKFLTLSAPPKRLIVLGGGPIGTELAQSFARLGSKVTQVEMAPRILIREDEEVSDLAKSALEADGVTVLTDHKAIACGIEKGERYIEVEANGLTSRLPYDELLVAVGRSARLKDFGLEELGIPAKRVVETDDYLATIYPNIYAAGDVAGPFQFTHTASHQAWFASVNALFGVLRRFKADYRVIPWATFLDPEIARVGLNEQEAREKGIAFEVTRYGIDDLDRAIADGSANGFVKVLTPPGKDRILGATIVGEHAGDLLAEFVLAMKHGLGLNKILGTIHTYPTLAEANKYIAGEWRRAHVNPKTMRLLERFHTWRRG